jgi:serine/threonine-protein kinase RsbT
MIIVVPINRGVTRQPEMTTIRISTREDAAIARAIAIHLASHLGMPLQERHKLAIAVSEIATNISRHALRGEIKISPVEHGIEVLAQDEGPGLPDLQSALRDGYSQGRTLQPDDIKRDGLGCGLGAICRMMDRVEFENLTPGGLRVRAWKWFAGGHR